MCDKLAQTLTGGPEPGWGHHSALSTSVTLDKVIRLFKPQGGCFEGGKLCRDVVCI